MGSVAVLLSGRGRHSRRHRTGRHAVCSALAARPLELLTTSACSYLRFSFRLSLCLPASYSHLHTLGGGAIPPLERRRQLPQLLLHCLRHIVRVQVPASRTALTVTDAQLLMFRMMMVIGTSGSTSKQQGSLAARVQPSCEICHPAPRTVHQRWLQGNVVRLGGREQARGERELVAPEQHAEAPGAVVQLSLLRRLPALRRRHARKQLPQGRHHLLHVGRDLRVAAGDMKTCNRWDTTRWRTHLSQKLLLGPGRHCQSSTQLPSQDREVCQAYVSAMTLLGNTPDCESSAAYL
jgi:hypothetical protein